MHFPNWQVGNLVGGVVQGLWCRCGLTNLVMIMIMKVTTTKMIMIMKVTLTMTMMMMMVMMMMIGDRDEI